MPSTKKLVSKEVAELKQISDFHRQKKPDVQPEPIWSLNFTEYERIKLAAEQAAGHGWNHVPVQKYRPRWTPPKVAKCPNCSHITSLDSQTHILSAHSNPANGEACFLSGQALHLHIAKCGTCRSVVLASQYKIVVEAHPRRNGAFGEVCPGVGKKVLE